MAKPDYDYEDELNPGYLESQLCVPQDRLEDIDFFPNFDDDFIRLTEELLPELDFLDDDIVRNQESNSTDHNKELSSLESEEHSRDDDWNREVSMIKNKKPRTQKPRKENSNLTFPLFVRRCLHCQAEKTPQWRQGPMGPNTLCNACGLRYKSGRLMPQYRPASSPSFDSCKHSNFYKRILKKKSCEEDNVL